MAKKLLNGITNTVFLPFLQSELFRETSENIIWPNLRGDVYEN